MRTRPMVANLLVKHYSPGLLAGWFTHSFALLFLLLFVHFVFINEILINLQPTKRRKSNKQQAATATENTIKQNKMQLKVKSADIYIYRHRRTRYAYIYREREIELTT